MLFDDRLATVLRSGAAGERAARTQFRQLLDLLGSIPPGANGPLVAAGYRRLDEICEVVPASEQARILREPGLRLRNPRLVAHLAKGPSQTAAAAMAAARLSENAWLALIPGFPLTARGFLRNRRDLPEQARRLLARLGVRDLVLPRPAVADESPAPPPRDEPEANGGIGALVRRIEAFQKARQGPAAVAPHLPLGIGEAPGGSEQPEAFDFSTDATGAIDWAEPAVAPLLVGLRLAGKGAIGSGACDPQTDAALRRRAVVHGGDAILPGADPVAGAWKLDAVPHFDAPTGVFRGHRGRMRRPNLAAPPERAEVDSSTDLMRQVLHELRTPVNAIQGFAEIIQQQIFGPAPNAYRALAGAVGVDAARLLAGFDEIDRLARLQGAALDLSTEGCNFRLVVERTLRRLEGVTRQRSALLRLLTSGEDFTVELGEDDSALLAWRLLATLAAALAPGEVVEMALRGGAEGIELQAELPVGLVGEHDLFNAPARREPLSVTVGMFGDGFTMRLARAEAEAAGGSLLIRGESLVLKLPPLTGAAPGHSQGDDDGSTAAA